MCFEFQDNLKTDIQTSLNKTQNDKKEKFNQEPYESHLPCFIRDALMLTVAPLASR